MIRSSKHGAAAMAILMLCAGCGDPFGSPQRPRTHGYRARAAVRHDGTDVASWSLAVRGASVRREDGSGVIVIDAAGRKAFRLEPARKTYQEVPFDEASKETIPGAPGYPLAPGFDEKLEAKKRGLTEYHRESDEVFAGHVCALWRFDDAPNDVTSPTTTYWVARDLDNLVVRMTREVPRPGGKPERTVAELTAVHAGADPELFKLPQGLTRAAPAR